MIIRFKNKATEDIFNGRASKSAMKACPKTLWEIACRKLDQLDSVVNFDDLRVPPGNRLEALSGNRKGQCSFRINSQYRICFIWTENGPTDVEITDYL
nr:type II toxin-antitoxin system RelE/ParE family toxin [Desulfosarcina widdelii]